MGEVGAKVIEFLREYCPEGTNLDALLDGAPLLRSGLLDSVGTFQLIGMLERRYGIEIPDAEIVPENFDTIPQIELLVARKLADAHRA